MKRSTPVSVVVTVLNEAHTVAALIRSLQRQTLLPSEVIIVDGGSSDGTYEKLRTLADSVLEFPVKVLQKKGNRSVGRNAGIAEAVASIVAITDAGCTLHASWIEALVSEYHRSQARVVAGYYTAVPKTAFQEAVIPYVLVMPDAVSPDTFLPATRSMLLEKTVWEELKGFPEKYSDNEDYVFAQMVLKAEVPRAVALKAVAVWQPVKSLSSFFWMIFRFARGDVYAGILRPKVIMQFARYCVAVLIAVGAPLLLLPTGTLYLSCAIVKNRRYVPNGWLWLPVLQVAADGAVLTGSLAGVLQRLRSK